MTGTTILILEKLFRREVRDSAVDFLVKSCSGFICRL